MVCTVRKISATSSPSSGRFSKLGQAKLHPLQPFLALREKLLR